MKSTSLSAVSQPAPTCNAAPSDADQWTVVVGCVVHASEGAAPAVTTGAASSNQMPFNHASVHWPPSGTALARLPARSYSATRSSYLSGRPGTLIAVEYVVD